MILFRGRCSSLPCEHFIGRLNAGKDVPARLAAVLPRSNHVLTLRRILHAQPQTPPLSRADRVEWRIQCIRFSLPLLLRTSTGVVPAGRLLNSPTVYAAAAAASAWRRRTTQPHRRGTRRWRAHSKTSGPSRGCCHYCKASARDATADAYRADRDCPCDNHVRPDPSRCRCRRHPAGTA
jgi:hypothetical protein